MHCQGIDVGTIANIANGVKQANGSFGNAWPHVTIAAITARNLEHGDGWRNGCPPGRL